MPETLSLNQAVRRVSGSVWTPGLRDCEPVERAVPEEIAVAISVGRKPGAVVIASPADYVDLGWGFALTEGLVAEPREIVDCIVSSEHSGIRVNLQVSAGTARLSTPRERLLPGRSSCGLCGISRLEDAVRNIHRVAAGGTMAPEALHDAFAVLHLHQPFNEETRAVHAAAHIRTDGSFTEVREDVGRHNALDKLVGALARAGIDPAEGAVLLTSRASYEMVDKAAAAGVRILAAISAPSALALRKAEFAGMTLVGIARRDSFIAFTGGERLGLTR